MDTIKFAEIAILLTFAVISDVKLYKIKNSILLPFLAGGIGTNLVESGLLGLKVSFQGILIPLLLLLIFYGAKMLGAGDVKLFATMGAIVGFESCLWMMVYGFIAGGILGVALILKRNSGKERALFLYHYVKACVVCCSVLPYSDFKVKTDGSKVHFAIPIAIGALLYYLFKF